MFMGLSTLKTKADQCDCYISVSSKGTESLIKKSLKLRLASLVVSTVFLSSVLKLDFRLATPVSRR